MLTPIIDPVLAEADGPSWLPDGETAPPLVVVVAGGRAAEVAGDLALGVGLLTIGVGDEGEVAGGPETETANQKQLKLKINSPCPFLLRNETNNNYILKMIR